MSQTATIGHNSGDARPIIDIEDATKAAQDVADEFKSKSADLVAGFERWKAANGTGIASDLIQGKSADFAKQLGATHKLIEEARTATKAPVLELGKAVDAAFKVHSEPLAQAKATVERVMTAYAVKKEQEARQRVREAADAERRRQQEAAELAAAEAALLGEDTPPEPLMVLVEASIPTAAEASRVVGDYGTVSSLRGKWKVRITDPALIPAQYLMPNIAAIEAAMEGSRIKKGEPTAKIAGVEFFLEQKIGNR
jgi:hypothetical protein